MGYNKLMRKDIESREVLDIGLALIPEVDKTHGTLWDVYLVNLKDDPIYNVLINVSGERSRGNSGTSTIRYHIPEVAGQSFHQIEVMLPEVAKLKNQYWLSFQHDNYMFDKKYIIDEDSISVEPDLIIPLMGKLGIWFE